MHNIKYDPSMENLKQGTKVGVVGESHIVLATWVWRY